MLIGSALALWTLNLIYNYEHRWMYENAKGGGACDRF